MANLQVKAKNKTASVPFVTTETVRTPMQLCSVMDATLLCTKSAMECLSFQKDNGSAENVSKLVEAFL